MEMHMKHIVRFCAVLAIALSVMPAVPALAGVTGAASPVYYYWLRNAQSRLCAQPEYEANWVGLTIVQQPCNEDDLYQQWQHIYVRNGLYHFVNRGSGQCLDDRDGATADWSPVQQWWCNDTSTTMQWRKQEVGLYTYRYINERSGKCLDVRSGSRDPGAVLQIYHCTNLYPTLNAAQAFDEAHIFVVR
jgi:Ricin-type beta-trefoil lectin domain-like